MADRDRVLLQSHLATAQKLISSGVKPRTVKSARAEMSKHLEEAGDESGFRSPHRAHSPHMNEQSRRSGRSLHSTPFSRSSRSSSRDPMSETRVTLVFYPLGEPSSRARECDIDPVPAKEAERAVVKDAKVIGKQSDEAFAAVATGVESHLKAGVTHVISIPYLPFFIHRSLFVMYSRACAWGA